MDGGGSMGFQQPADADPAPSPAGQVPRPAGPPPVPPRPAAPPSPHRDLVTWVHTERPVDVPGVYRFGHVPRPPEDPDRITNRRLLLGALLSPVLGWVVWRLVYLDVIPAWRFLALVSPESWDDEELMWDSYFWLLRLTVVAGVLYFGQWLEVYRRFVEPRVPPRVLALPPLRRFTTPELLRDAPSPHTAVPAHDRRRRGADTPSPRLLVQALLTAVLGWVVWRLMWEDTIPVWWFLERIAPESWLDEDLVWDSYAWLLRLTVVAGVLYFGQWLEVYRRFVEPRVPPRVLALPPLRTFTARRPPRRPEPPLPAPASAWPDLRAAGATALADRLDAEVRSGRMTDVDYVRISRAWENARMHAERSRVVTETVLRQGGASFTHPSGARDLPARSEARHDLLVSQLRLGLAPDQEKNPWAYRNAAIALDPGMLSTSLVAVGPPGSGKTRSVLRPVVESLNLQALCGRAAVVAVGPAEADLGPREAFDVVISLGDPASDYDFDLYGGAADPDEAAACLAEALLPEGEVDSRAARTALGQLLGPFHAAHGRYPAVGELRELLDGTPDAFAALRGVLDAAGAHQHLRDLMARERLHGRPEDVGPALADRVALLNRPAFAGFFDVHGLSHPFSLRALEHPLRVRICLPARGHAEASRILTRLVLAQFAAAVAARADRSLFACLVVDDAAHAVTEETVRDLQRLRSGHAGAVLALRSLDDVPEPLRGALLGAVGCHVALAGINTWDGGYFAETWGKTWVDDPRVTRAPDHYGGSFRRSMNTLRKLVTGRAVTTESVTVRKVERERWSASELAHSVPPGHAVVSLVTASGERVPPLLVDLNG
ncbi:ATP-binding protein [Wenjunlia vitaminophila]|uniref:ATP-binding protein n=1 Tax=Wenjunlia vitaminophila TaxID=76728 RepID=A0A0T6LYC1_WENVI|nr:hypothetical protein [Wenjunlia vitaminophila]KRV51025.1 ATP-binding protein [Wenjunlia vitaminophila]